MKAATSLAAASVGSVVAATIRAAPTRPVLGEELMATQEGGGGCGDVGEQVAEQRRDEDEQ